MFSESVLARQAHAREWSIEFGRFLWHRFVEDRCFESAAVLAFGTTLALVPLSTAVFGILSAFPVFDTWSQSLSRFLFTNFVPGAARTVEGYLEQFTTSASQLTTLGLSVVMISALMIMKGVEDTFNRIWRVGVPRHGGARFLMYWTVLTLGPMLAGASLALSSWLLDAPWMGGADTDERSAWWSWAPRLIELMAFTLAYRLIPNRVVRWSHAAAGGVAATLLFEGAKHGLGLYLASVPSYQQIYGAVAAVPIFLIWLYISWAVVLLGASLAASLSAFRFQPSSQRLTVGSEWLAALRVCGRFVAAQRGRAPLSLEAIRDLEPGIDDAVLNHLLEDLTDAQILQRTEEGSWVLACDPKRTGLGEVYRAVRAVVPLQPWHGPGTADALGERILAALTAQGRALSTSLEPSLDTLVASESMENTT